MPPWDFAAGLSAGQGRSQGKQFSSSARRRGPINAGRCFAKAGAAAVKTTSSGGYGSPPSRGRHHAASMRLATVFLVDIRSPVELTRNEAPWLVITHNDKPQLLEPAGNGCLATTEFRRLEWTQPRGFETASDAVDRLRIIAPTVFDEHVVAGRSVSVLPQERLIPEAIGLSDCFENRLSLLDWASGAASRHLVDGHRLGLLGEAAMGDGVGADRDQGIVRERLQLVPGQAQLAADGVLVDPMAGA